METGLKDLGHLPKALQLINIDQRLEFRSYNYQPSDGSTNTYIILGGIRPARPSLINEIVWNRYGH